MKKSSIHKPTSNVSISLLITALWKRQDNVYVLPSEFGWSDLGTWASIYELAEKDYVGNAVIPSEKVIMYDSSTVW
jgi:mannose-1-phosphate guanylyltransferase